MQCVVKEIVILYFVSYYRKLLRLCNPCCWESWSDISPRNQAYQKLRLTCMLWEWACRSSFWPFSTTLTSSPSRESECRSEWHVALSCIERYLCFPHIDYRYFFLWVMSVATLQQYLSSCERVIGVWYNYISCKSFPLHWLFLWVEWVATRKRHLWLWKVHQCLKCF